MHSARVSEIRNRLCADGDKLKTKLMQVDLLSECTKLMSDLARDFGGNRRWIDR